MLLGFGINSYFDIMEQMCKMFCTISIFFIPIIFMYVTSKENALAKEAATDGYPYLVSAFSIGNMGGSNVRCH